MDLEDLSKETTEASAKAVQRAVELSETARLGVLIASEEKKINDAYAQIGRRTVAMDGGAVERECAGLADMIHEAEGRVRGYRSQMERLQGLRVCDRCGAGVPEGAAFCAACGQAAAHEDRVKCHVCGALVIKGSAFCTVCGKPLGGVSSEPAVTSGSAHPAEPPKPVEAPKPAEPPRPAEPQKLEEIPITGDPSRGVVQSRPMEQPRAVPGTSMPHGPSIRPVMPQGESASQGTKICQHCGAKIPSYSAFCTECGKRL